MRTQWKAEQWSVPITEHGEGPFWDEVTNQLRVLDMLNGDVLAIDSAGLLVDRRHFDKVVSIVRRTTTNELLVGGERQVFIENLAGDVRTIALPVPIDCRLNEGHIAPGGALYLGSMAYDMHGGGGALWRVDLDSEVVTTILPSVSISNGMAFDPTNPLCYYVDSLEHAVHAFTVRDSGELVDRRIHCDLSDVPGMPDGMALAHDGCLYVAMWDGGRVVRIDPSGTIDGEIILPVSQVTACTFGGNDSNELFITTSSFGLSDERRTTEGAIFRCTTGTPNGR